MVYEGELVIVDAGWAADDETGVPHLTGDPVSALGPEPVGT